MSTEFIKMRNFQWFAGILISLMVTVMGFYTKGINTEMAEVKQNVKEINIEQREMGEAIARIEERLSIKLTAQ